MSISIDPQVEAEMINKQEELRKLVNNNHKLENVRFVAGCDVTVDNDLTIGCLVIVDMENNNSLIYSDCKSVTINVPYIPGLLCFREGPIVLQLIEDYQKSKNPVNIDLIIVDGCGEWHPRAFGLGCYVGVHTSIPTIGVSKTYLYVGNNKHSRELQNESQSKCPNKGDYWVLDHVIDGIEIHCAIMRTTDSTPFNPIYISSGNNCSLSSAAEIVRKLCIFREPEPTRLADRISRKYVREQKQPPK